MVSGVSLYLPGDDSLLEAASAAYAKISVEAEITGAYKYADEKEAVKLAAAAAAKGERAVIIADDGRFNTIKLLIMKALLTKVGHSDVISEKLSGISDRESKEFRIQTAVPHGAKIFPSADGMYSALSAKLRKGFIILASLDSKKLDAALADGLLKDLPGNRGSGKDMLRSCLESAEKAGKSIALADYGLSQAVMSVAAGVGAKDGLIIRAEASCDAEPGDPQYIALLAKDAILKAGGDSIGAAISEPSADGSISVCVADLNSAKVEVVHALEGEDKSKTAKAATIKLFEMIAGGCEIVFFAGTVNNERAFFFRRGDQRVKFAAFCFRSGRFFSRSSCFRGRRFFSRSGRSMTSLIRRFRFLSAKTFSPSRSS